MKLRLIISILALLAIAATLLGSYLYYFSQQSLGYLLPTICLAIGVLVYFLYKAAYEEILKRKNIEQALAQAQAELENQVARRTADLRTVVEQLRDEAVQRQEAAREVERSYRVQRVMNEVLRESMTRSSLTDMLQHFIDQVTSLAEFELMAKGAVFLVDRGAGELILKAQRNLAAPLLDTCRQVPFGRCLCGLAAGSRQIVFSDQLDDRHDHRYAGIEPHGHYCVPILTPDRAVLGVFTVYTRAGTVRSARVEEFLVAMAALLANIIQHSKSEKERLRLQMQLRQAQKMEAIGTLAGGIAHDFNNILTSLLGYAFLLKEEVPDDAEIREDLEQVIKAGERAKNLVRQILTFSRQTEQEAHPVQIELIVKEALKLLRASLPATIEIRQTISAADTMVLADPTQIHQVLMNLCTNAYQAMREDGGVLEVGLDSIRIEPGPQLRDQLLPAGDYLLLTVSDTGCGMSQDIIPRIFEPYFSTKKKEDGTGLGLAVVHGIVSALGGTVTAESELGNGSVFSVLLPAAVNRDGQHECQRPDSPPHGTEHILVVDDELQIARLEQRLLESLGYKVTIHTSSIEALEAFRNHPHRFDLVLTDLTMPNMTGARLAEELRVIRPDIAVALCTGFSEHDSRLQAQRLGIKAFLNKPVTKYDLARAVREALGDRAKIEGLRDCNSGP